MCFFPVELGAHHLFCKIERSEMKHSAQPMKRRIGEPVFELYNPSIAYFLRTC